MIKMKRFYLIALSGVGVLLIMGSVVCGQDVFRSATPEVKSTMKKLDEFLNKVEDALMAGDLPRASSLAKDLDTATHKLCNIDLSTSKLTSAEQEEFKRLREDFHYRIDRFSAAAKESSTDIAQFEFEKARQSCGDCHKLFKKKKA